MSSTITEGEKLRRLPWFYLSSAANNIFASLTVFGTVFILFLNELGLSSGRIGLILSFYSFCGIIALLIAPWVARFGVKRTYLTFWSARKTVTCFVLLAPLVRMKFGSEATFYLIASVIFIFALCRSIGETGYYVWLQEFVPNSVRGRAFGLNTAAVNLTGLLALLIATHLIAKSDNMNTFLIMIAIGIVFGFISVWCASRLPAGDPVTSTSAEAANFRSTLSTLHDKKFLYYLCGTGAILFANGSLSMIPLYLKEHVELRSGSVMLVAIAGILGALFSSYIWGKFVDKYGTRLLTLCCPALMGVSAICWLFISRGAHLSLVLALAAASASSMLLTGWQAADQRLLYNDVILSNQKNRYMALYYAWIGIAGGAGTLLAGYSVEYFHEFSATIGPIHLDKYAPLLLASSILMASGAVLLSRVSSTSRELRDTSAVERITVSPQAATKAKQAA